MIFHISQDIKLENMQLHQNIYYESFWKIKENIKILKEIVNYLKLIYFN